MKTIKRFLLFLTFFVLCFISSFSQSNFLEGYYINSSGDSITGYVKYIPGIKSFTSCIFKLSRNQKAQYLTPSEIQGYGFKDLRSFASRTVDISSKKTTGFFEYLLKGEINLFQYRERFYVEFDDRLEWLYIHENRLNDTLVHRSSEHLKILAEAFEKCPEIRREVIEDVPAVILREKDLLKLFTNYYDCAGENYIIPKKLPWFKLEAGAFAGIEASQYKFRTLFLFSEVSGTDFGTTGSLVYGLSFNLSTPRLTQRFKLQIEPYFQANDFVGYKEGVFEQNIIRQDFRVKYREFAFPFGLKYILNPQWNNLFISTGISPQFYSNNEYTYLREVENTFNQTVVYSEPKMEKIRSHAVGAWFNVGIMLINSPRFKIPIQLRIHNNGSILKTPFLYNFGQYGVKARQTSVFLTSGIQF